MQVFRTVTAVEHALIPVVDASALASVANGSPYLTSYEAEVLLKLNDLHAGFCQRTVGGVKFSQHCGVVRTASCVVEIVPKVGVANEASSASRGRAALLSMLHRALRLKISTTDDVRQGVVRAPLLDIFVREFLLCALELAQSGLICRYTSEADNLTIVKGRFNTQGHLRRNIARPHLVYCEYDEFTIDNPFNRAVRATLDACRPWAKRASTQRLWFELHARLTGVSQVRFAAADVRNLRYDRQTLRYRPLMLWCERLLELASPDLRGGSATAPSILFDMNRLFEDHVCNREEIRERESGNRVIRQGPQRALVMNGPQPLFALKPDISVWNTSSAIGQSPPERIVDAKWKVIDPRSDDWGVEQADLYQMLAYAGRYGCTHLELVYPQPVDLDDRHIPPVFRLEDARSGTITLITVSLAPLI